MADEDINLRITADVDPLKKSLSEAETLLARLDHVVGQHSQSIARSLTGVLGLPGTAASRRRKSPLEQLAVPLIEQVASNVLKSIGAASQQQPVNLAMNIATPDANSFRMSQGQILAEAAAAIARVTKRYL